MPSSVTVCHSAARADSQPLCPLQEMGSVRSIPSTVAPIVVGRDTHGCPWAKSAAVAGAEQRCRRSRENRPRRSKTMAKVRPSGVRVNIVTPGLTTGEPLKAMFEGMAEAQNRTPEEVSDGFARRAAVCGHVDPDDIAQAVLFLASPGHATSPVKKSRSQPASTSPEQRYRKPGSMQGVYNWSTNCVKRPSNHWSGELRE